jgi:predicted DNA repair protein MutK
VLRVGASARDPASRGLEKETTNVAGTGLLALLDDIATILDDVAAMTKVATKKTAGVLGDDLALNAEQVTGVSAERELPVVWAVARGSALNKVILVPAALAVSAVAPWMITPLLMLGGGFLCYEGFEKIVHRLLHSNEAAAHDAALARAAADPAVDLVAFEKRKIRDAVRTDFILSAEVLVIALDTVAGVPFGQRVAVMVAIAAIVTVGVYGLVAAIVKLDDAGLALERRASAAARRVGALILVLAPYLMKGLGLAGTAAMFLVGGGILAHGLPFLEPWLADAERDAGPLGVVVPTLADATVGVVAGGLLVAAVEGGKRALGRSR